MTETTSLANPSHYLRSLLDSVTGLNRLDPKSKEYEARYKGLDWPGPGAAETMIGVARLFNLEALAIVLFERGIQGDFVECGVWRGGACIYMRAIQIAHGQGERKVWVVDSFRGAPPPNPDKYPADLNDPHHSYQFLQVSADEVRRNFEKYGLLSPNVIFLEGFVQDTLPTAPIEQIALLRLDMDMYEATYTALANLYPKVVPGGYIVCDDYHNIPQCKQAILDFRVEHDITDPIENIDWCAVYWRKPLQS